MLPIHLSGWTEFGTSPMYLSMARARTTTSIASSHGTIGPSPVDDCVYGSDEPAVALPVLHAVAYVIREAVRTEIPCVIILLLNSAPVIPSDSRELK